MVLLFFALGAIIASFMGVVAGRLFTGASIARGRSQCDACGRALRASSLVPIFSYVASRARARCCGARLSPRLFLSEIALGVLFAAAYAKLGATPLLALVLIALALLLCLVLYDLAHQILPYPLLVPFVLVSTGAGALAAPSAELFIESLMTAAGIGAFLALIHALSRGRAMGAADAPLAFGLALLAGPFAFSGFVYSFWIGAVIGIGMLFGKPAGSRMGIEVPFAPFLACGFLLAYFTQWNILNIIGIFNF